MPTRTKWNSGVLNRGRRGGSTRAEQLTGSGKIKQITLLFDGVSSSAKESYFELSFGQSASVDYPTPEMIKSTHGSTLSGTTKVHLTDYKDPKYLYGYYFLIDDEYDHGVDLVLHNGDDDNQTQYEYWILYDDR